ncbi:MAG: 16S rRNA (cytosine(1402)-N(4))-methyltransferase RsmH [Phototrophicaceae bacterium]|jgi:16S rRNA (cytosine1402-N4)-methyltransferase
MTDQPVVIPHIPVLLQETLAALIPDAANPPARVIDGTLGAGGHTEALFNAGVGEVLGIDQDPSALELATARLAPFGERFHPVHGNYESLAAALQSVGWKSVDGILLDIGVSSMQLDRPERGFSFARDGALDMRMNPTVGQTAADLVNTWDAEELADIFYRYGEERYGRALARVIVQHRPYATTHDLANVIAAHKPAQWKEKIHPATRVFQALRIAVNDELGVLERVLPKAIQRLNVGGRLAVISFHSLEDRIVKHAFQYAALDCICPPRQPICTCDKVAEVEIITRKPIAPTDAEIAQNPRSRSAKLRVVERIAP